MAEYQGRLTWDCGSMLRVRLEGAASGTSTSATTRSGSLCVMDIWHIENKEKRIWAWVALYTFTILERLHFASLVHSIMPCQGYLKHLHHLVRFQTTSVLFLPLLRYPLHQVP